MGTGLAFSTNGMDRVDQILTSLTGRDRWVVTSHARPDGDAIGSSLACALMLGQLGKQAEIVMHDPVPRIYRWLPGANSIINSDHVNGQFDGGIILECDGLERSRVEGLEKLFLINIDHHNTMTEFGAVNWVVPNASATADLIYKLAKRAGVRITPEMATCLYTAVLTDTGMYCYAGTDADTFRLAQELVAAGADPVSIAQKTFFANPGGKMRLLGAAMRTLKVHDKLATMHVLREDFAECGAVDEDCEGLANYALGIEGVEVAAFFREMTDGNFRVSLRSKSGIDVAAIAEHFGGGGHHAASGHSLSGPLDRARELVVCEVRKHMIG
ncbi:MAG TPA: DHH family phosphoesterase [candidate division Zixibacteria bacterium]|nr:DHH family phosphoesterase [candidate division Zixibacteria bacterium]